MKTLSSKLIRCLSLLCVAVWAVADTVAGLDIQLYAGLTITGAVGTVYQIQYVTDLAQTNNASAWSCLEFLQLPASPYLWADKSAPPTGQRFYRAAVFPAPTNMVFIPPGTFRMGSPTNEGDPHFSYERPQTSVIISRGFWMGKYETTQGEYLAIMGNNPSRFNGILTNYYDPSCGCNTNRDIGTDLTRPVETVSWYDATNYCARLTEQAASTGAIPPGSQYRLPTEAEWEYACRAWTSDRRFFYGDDPDHTNLVNYCWFDVNSGFTTHSVGEKLPNAWGLYDMGGNVAEWCQDRFVPYSGGLSTDPKGDGAYLQGVVRGGSWSGLWWYCRSAYRGVPYRDVKNPFCGFRIVLAQVSP